jgi:hypothetical protein
LVGHHPSAGHISGRGSGVASARGWKMVLDKYNLQCLLDLATQAAIAARSVTMTGADATLSYATKRRSAIACPTGNILVDKPAQHPYTRAGLPLCGSSHLGLRLADMGAHFDRSSRDRPVP